MGLRGIIKAKRTNVLHIGEVQEERLNCGLLKGRDFIAERALFHLTRRILEL